MVFPIAVENYGACTGNRGEPRNSTDFVFWQYALLFNRAECGHSVVMSASNARWFESDKGRKGPAR
jgi:hypothetical protein